MSAPDYGLDPGPCDHATGLVCLLDVMQPFDVRWLVDWVFETTTRVANVSPGAISAVDNTQATSAMSFMAEWLEAQGLPTSAALAKRLKNELSKGDYFTAGNYAVSQYELIRRITDEMRASAMYLRLEGDEPKYFSGKALSWGDAPARFVVQDEINEGMQCFALGRYPASVFHMMRVLEIGLNALAGELGVPFEHRNWENVIAAIEAELVRREKAPNTPPDPHRKARLHFYGESARHFRFLKEAWRNYAVHVKETYDHGTAQSVLQHVSEFIRQLATERPWETP